MLDAAGSSATLGDGPGTTYNGCPPQFQGGHTASHMVEGAGSTADFLG